MPSDGEGFETVRTDAARYPTPGAANAALPLWRRLGPELVIQGGRTHAYWSGERSGRWLSNRRQAACRSYRWCMALPQRPQYRVQHRTLHDPRLPMMAPRGITPSCRVAG